jgi:hypothetical protein
MARDDAVQVVGVPRERLRKTPFFHGCYAPLYSENVKKVNSFIMPMG